MKKTSIFLIAGLIFSASAFAQKKFTEGVISYDIVINTDSDKPQAADFLDGATTTVFLKGNKSRTEMVSSLGTQSTIIDGAKNSYVILKDYGTQKYMINLSLANWQEMNAKYQGIRFTLLDSTKQIQGYNCKKAVGKLSDGTPVNVWYTPEITLDNKNFNMLSQSLPGLPMEYEASMGNLNILYTVSRVAFGPVQVAKFDLPKAGYRVMTYEESKGSQK
jgi:GLPGLI family protein